MPARERRIPVVADKIAPPFQLGPVSIAPGTRSILEFPLSMLSTHTPMTLPVQVVHGRHPGPVMFVSAAVHGDELNGVEIIRRLLKHSAVRRLRGTLITVPIVNVYGFIGRTRYLPDGRDLNRSFPGSPTGSLARQLAYLFQTEILQRCTHGVDLHTGGGHRENLPHVRACLSEPDVRRLAEAFGAPLILDASLRDGSLREAAQQLGIPTLLYEGGAALRFDEVCIRTGVAGLLRVMEALDMISRKPTRRPPADPLIARSSQWTRSPAGGILRTPCRLGTLVEREQTLGIVADPFGEVETPVQAECSGIVLGRATLPVVNRGDALFNIARYDDTTTAEERLEAFQESVIQYRDDLDLWRVPRD